MRAWLDRRITNSASRSCPSLKALDVPTELVIYPDEWHLFLKPADQIDVATRLVGWFDRWMPASK